MAKASSKKDTWKPQVRKDPIKPGIRDDLGGSYSIADKVDRAQKADVMRGGSKAGKC